MLMAVLLIEGRGHGSESQYKKPKLSYSFWQFHGQAGPLRCCLTVCQSPKHRDVYLGVEHRSLASCSHKFSHVTHIMGCLHTSMLAGYESTMAEADPWDPLLSFGQLSLASFITVSCVNRSLKRLCEQRVAARTAAQDLLLQAVSAAAAAAQPASSAGLASPQPATHGTEAADERGCDAACWEQQVAWLLKQAPNLLQDSTTMSALLHVHNVPCAVASVLLRAGARFNWQQLQEAAGSFVPGLHVWLALSRELQLQLDQFVPRVAAAICCGDEVDLQVRIEQADPAAICL
jgi:hypothetical protein